jgi:ZIP family zinc transporter
MVSGGDVRTALLLTCMGACGTALGGLIVVAQPDMSYRRLGLLQGLAGGLMLSLSFVDLLPQSMQAVGFLLANLWFYGGVLFFGIIVYFIPEPSAADAVIRSTEAPMPDKASKQTVKAVHDERRQRKDVLMSGIITAIGISLHNFPEGIAVFLASMKSQAVGLSIAVAIALHNIPEGVAVALPVYFATKSRWTGFKYAALSGLAEPAAVIFVALVLPVDLSPELVEQMLAGVGGIMTWITLHELLPSAFQHAGKEGAIIALFLGMMLMSCNLYMLDVWNGDHGH